MGRGGGKARIAEGVLGLVVRSRGDGFGVGWKGWRALRREGWDAKLSHPGWMRR